MHFDLHETFTQSSRQKIHVNRLFMCAVMIDFTAFKSLKSTELMQNMIKIQITGIQLSRNSFT